MKKVAYLDSGLVELNGFLGICDSEQGFKRELKRLHVTDYPFSWMSDGCDGKTHFLEKEATGECVYLVCIRRNSKVSKLQMYGLLVHEAVHVWQAFKESIGEKYPSSEFEAYSIQSISQRLMVAFSDKIKTGN